MSIHGWIWGSSRLQSESLLGWILSPTCLDTALYKATKTTKNRGGKAGNFSGERVGGEEVLTLIAFHGTGIFTYLFTIKINHSSIGKYTSPMWEMESNLTCLRIFFKVGWFNHQLLLMAEISNNHLGWCMKPYK